MEEELKKDHAEMQAAVDSKQKIIDAQVGGSGPLASATGGKDVGCGAGDLGFITFPVPHCKSCREMGDQDLCSKKLDLMVLVDKLARTGYERGEATPPLLGQLGGYCLSPGLLTKEWKLLVGEWGGWG